MQSNHGSQLPIQNNNHHHSEQYDSEKPLLYVMCESSEDIQECEELKRMAFFAAPLMKFLVIKFLSM